MKRSIQTCIAAVLAILAASATFGEEPEGTNEESPEPAISELDLRAIELDEVRTELKRRQEAWTAYNLQPGQGARSGNVRVRMLAAEQRKLLDEARLLQEAMKDLDNKAWPSLRQRLQEKQAEYEAAWERMQALEEQEQLARQQGETRRRQRRDVWTTTIQR